MTSSTVALSAKEAHAASLLKQDGVIGVGVGHLDPDDPAKGSAVIVYVKDGLPKASMATVSQTLKAGAEEVPVRVEVTGEFFANDMAQVESWAFLPMAGHPEYSRRIRPMPPGYSIGTPRASGTAGLIVINNPAATQLYIASNCHVINGNNDTGYYETIQAGGADGGISGRDRIGRADRFVPLRKADNYMDAATAIPDSNTLLDPSYPTVGPLPGHYKQYSVGWDFYKVGRTTGPVTGRVDSVHTDLAINYGSYGGLGTIGFRDQTVVLGAQPVSLPGDSGSIWLRQRDKYACAVNYAGSGDGRRSICFPFNWFADAFKVLVARPGRTRGEIVQIVGEDEKGLYSSGAPAIEVAPVTVVAA